MHEMLILSSVAPRLGLPVNEGALNSVTRGLVGDTSFAILPNVTKEHTFALTFIFQMVSSVRLFKAYAVLTYDA